MKLQKQVSRKVKGKEYSKWVLVLPSSIIKKLGWKEGAELNARAEKKKMIIQKNE
jgi:bifunctional DNA-binding transcriptional regulator/antitoxin component of YhaV-PrlF toxin-antitoxin module